MPDKQPVVNLLRNLREARGQSLRTAARDLGVDPSYLSRVETGRKPMPERLSARVADYYETDVDVIALGQGRIPDDVRRILAEHPELLEELRRRYGAS